MHNPGWFTPEEARIAVAAGYAGRMMLDWLEPDPAVGNAERIWVLAPASEGHGGDKAPELPDFQSFFAAAASSWCKGRCVMLIDRRCSIHESGFKPLQCHLMNGCDEAHLNTPTDPASNYSVARLWDTALGREVVREWRVALPQMEEKT
jgi:hypothetical protein